MNTTVSQSGTPQVSNARTVKIVRYAIQLAATLAVTVGAWLLLRLIYIWNENSSDMRYVIASTEEQPFGWVIAGVVLGVPALLVALLAKGLLAPFHVGCHRVSLKMAAGESVCVRDLFSGYGKGAFSAFSVAFAKYGILYLLFLIPLIVAQVSCSIIQDKWNIGSVGMILALFAVGVVCTALVECNGLFLLSWEMTDFVLSENPSMDVREALAESSLLMRKNKLRFVRRQIGYIGLCLLGNAILFPSLWFAEKWAAACPLFDLHFPIVYPYLLIFFIVEFTVIAVRPFFLEKQAVFFRQIQSEAVAAAKRDDGL